MRTSFTALVMVVTAAFGVAAQDETTTTPSDNVQGTKVISYNQILGEGQDNNTMRACYVRWNETDGEATISNLFASVNSQIEVPVTINENDQSVIIKSQELGIYDVDNIPTNIILELYASVDTYTGWVATEEATGKLSDSGSFDFEYYQIVIRSADDETPLLGFTNLQLDPAPDFTPSEPEWHLQGEAVFYEGWLSPRVNCIFEPETLRYWTNTEKPGWYAFENPYASEQWWYSGKPTQGGTREGWIVIDASNPDCVCAMPFVASGLWWGTYIAQEQYVLNIEGYRKVCQNISPEEQLKNWNWEEDMRPSTMKDGIIRLNNLAMYSAFTPLDLDIFVTPTTTVFEIKSTGIADIDSDVDMPVKYYNLQGLEVKHPSAGEVMIRRHGNRCDKIVF